MGDSVRKLHQADVAYCCRCRSDIRYGSRGLVAIQDHIVTTLHQSKASVDNNFLLPGVGPAHSETPYWLNPARCNVQQIVPLPPMSRPLVSMVDRIANQEAILLGFLAEHSLPFSMAPSPLSLPGRLVVQRLRITFSSDCAFCDKSTTIFTLVVLDSYEAMGTHRYRHGNRPPS